ncbi:MAG: hypothetical protein L6Q76_26175, partial [Polyangiaceae bacterium]|nr:hypothetical protein [Polyangiaceae bacterium]
GAAALAEAPTGSTWGRTARRSGALPKGAGKGSAVAGLLFGIIVVGGTGVWLARRPSPDSAALPQPTEVAPAATETGAPALQVAVPPVPEVTSSATEAPATDVPKAASKAPTKTKEAPDALSSSGKPKSRAPVGNVTVPPAPSPTSKPAATGAPAPPSSTPPPPHTAAPQKPKHEGVF